VQRAREGGAAFIILLPLHSGMGMGAIGPDSGEHAATATYTPSGTPVQA